MSKKTPIVLSVILQALFYLVIVSIPASCLHAGVLNVKNFGAVGDGIGDDRPAIQLAINSANPWDTVFLPAGVYLVGEIPHPYATGYGVCLCVPGPITFAGEGMDVTTIKLADGGIIWPIYSSVIMNLRPWELGLDHDIIFRDFTIDGNAANNTLPAMQYGITMIRTQRVWHENVRVKNVRGTLCHQPGEGFHFEYQWATDGYYDHCEVMSDDGGMTASGFSCDKSSAVQYSDCIAHGMERSMGFTLWSCDNIQYFNCSAHHNRIAQFHSELSNHLDYSGCTAGTEDVESGAGAGISGGGWYFCTITNYVSHFNKYGIIFTRGGQAGPVTISNIEISDCSKAGFYIPNQSKKSPISISDVTLARCPHAFKIRGDGYLSLAAGLKLFSKAEVR